MREMTDLNVSDFENREAGDKNVYVRFYTHPVQNHSKSDEAGRPVYDEKEYVEIRTPGDQNNIIKRPVTDMDRQRFSKPYAMFKEGLEEQLVGTPISEAPWLTRAQVEELFHLRIRTVEQLAGLSDSVCSKTVGMYKLKQRAQKMIDDGKNDAPFLLLQTKAEEQARRIEELETIVKEQSDTIRGLQAAKSK